MKPGDLLNGAKLPNWVHLAALFIVLGWIAAAQWFGVKQTQTDIRHEIAGLRDTLSMKADTKDVQEVTNRLDDIQDQIATVNGKASRLRAIDQKLQDVHESITAMERRHR